MAKRVTMPPADFGNREKLHSWMRRQPPEAARVLAARAAMRVLPFIHSDPRFQPEDRPDRRLTLFRANAIAFAYSATPADKQIANAADSVRDLTQADAFLYGSTKVASRAIQAISSGFPLDSGRRAESAAKAITTSQFHQTGTIEAAGADAASLNAGISTLRLAASPLWPSGCPAWVMQTWVSLRDDLFSLDEQWEVWTNWYEARLAGAPYDQALERSRAIYAFENRPQTVILVNSALARVIENHQGYPALIPEERITPAVFVNAAEQIDAFPPSVALDPRKVRVIASAQTALIAVIDGFASGNAGAQFPKLIASLRRCEAALGRDSHSLDVIGLGVHASVLAGYAARADEFLLPEDAAQLTAIVEQLASFLSQFEEWSRYSSSVSVPLGAADAELQAVRDARAAMEQLMLLAPGLFSDRAKEALTALEDAAVPDSDLGLDPAVRFGLIRSYLRAVRSAFLAVGIWLLDQVKQGAGKGIQGTVGLAAAAAISSVGVLLYRLASSLPAEFGFLSGLLSFLSRLGGGV